jgi:hypothetical protein
MILAKARRRRVEPRSSCTGLQWWSNPRCVVSLTYGDRHCPSVFGLGQTRRPRYQQKPPPLGVPMSAQR